MKKLSKISIIVVLAIACFSGGGKASAASDTFACSSIFYQVISGQLESLDPLTGVYTNIGSNVGFNYNAIGYNVLDNYIYGIATSGTHSGDIYRINNTGVATDLGLPTGLPGTGFDNGSFDLAGNLYIRTNANNDTIYEVNVGNDPASASTMTVTPLTITGAGGIEPGNDNVVIGNNFYTLYGANLSVVNLTNDTVTTSTVTGPNGWLNAGVDFGAAWADQSGELFFSNNESGSIYQISNYTTSSPTASFEVTGTVTSNNDGTSCPLATQSPFDPPVANNNSYSTLFNIALNEESTSLLSNDVGDSLTVTSNTNPMHGTVKVNSDGTFLYTPNNGFSGTDSFNYTVTDAFGRTASATVTITVLPPTTSKAPNTGFGMPKHSNNVTIGLETIATTLIGSGLWILLRQKQTYAREYKIDSSRDL